MSDFQDASQYKVLVVDDTSEFRADITERLAEMKFHVRSVDNYHEALQVLTTERFHIVLIDGCLDEANPADRSGVELMRALQNIDPSAGIIMMDDKLDPYFMREILHSDLCNPSVYDVRCAQVSQYIEKTEKDLKQLPKFLNDIMGDELRINSALQIVDQDQLLKMIASQIILPDPKPEPREILSELNELISKLFSNWQRVELMPIKAQRRGFSKAYVFQVIPYNDDGRGAKLVVKLGAQALIGREVERYQQYIQYKMQNQLYPTVITPVCRTKLLGGIIYTFAGLTEEVRDFAEFFRDVPVNDGIAPAIKRIFSGSLRLQLTGTNTTHHDKDLGNTYRQMLRLKDEELAAQQVELFDRLKVVQVPTRPEFFWLSDGTQMVNPLYFAQTTSFRMAYSEATIHGDLHSHNILLDGNNTSWLIDFAETCKGPRFQDFVALESSIMFENNECQDIGLLLLWAQALLSKPGDLLPPPLPDDLVAVRELAKVHAAVLAVRNEASIYMTNPEIDTQAYLVGLFFTALRMTTVKFLPFGRRFHALAVASRVAENLGALERMTVMGQLQ